MAWWWYPSNDHPADKATFDISVTVPEGKQAISNGVLASRRTSAGQRRTYGRDHQLGVEPSRPLPVLLNGRLGRQRERRLRAGDPVASRLRLDLLRVRARRRRRRP
ncbi:hypothetical protein [Nonomuraea sp. NPDC052265]|uniref:hypothetical protein n=1 Tax=Nonomuraea sp. NPDC052265 TaxID=3364374 RepID=UPI0037C98F4B